MRFRHRMVAFGGSLVSERDVSFIEYAWFMLDSNVILHNTGDGSFCSQGQLLGFPVVCQICVVGVDGSWLSQYQMLPDIKSSVESGEFFVVNVIIHFFF